MAIVGHWKNLVEANKLQQSKLLAGVVQEIYDEGEMIQRLPVVGLDSISIKWNLEKTLPQAAYYPRGAQIPWTGDVDYDQREFSLKQVVRQDPLDKFMAKNFRNPNDYRAVMIRTLARGCRRTIEDRVIYGDEASNPDEHDGLFSLIKKTTQCIDNGETVLSMSKFTTLYNLVKPKPDFFLMGPELHDRATAVAMYGVSTGSTNVRVGAASGLSMTDIGMVRVPSWAGVPFIRSTFMVAEQADTGPCFSTARAKFASGTKQYSILAARLGQIEDGGVGLLIGANTGGPDFFDIISFENLEDYNAEGIRLVAYVGMYAGNSKCVAAIIDITDAEFTI